MRGISLDGCTGLGVIASGCLTAIRYKDEYLLKFSDLALVQWALVSSWCQTMPGLIWPS